MKFGYSMLQQDAIAAEDLTYGSCEELLVVCPMCKEGVFKKVRQSSSNETHYLSHYQSNAQSAECELRTKDLTREQIKQIGTGVVRGQSMEEFYLSFQEIFYTSLTDPSCADPEFDIYLEIKKTMSNPNFNWYFNQLIAEIQNPLGSHKGPMWKIPLSEIPLEFLYFKLLNNAWKIAGVKTLPGLKTLPTFIDRSFQFTQDTLDHISNLQQTSLLRFLVAAAFTMCLRPNAHNKEMAEMLSTVTIIFGNRSKDFDVESDEFVKQVQQPGNFYEAMKTAYPNNWSTTIIGSVVLEIAEKMFSQSKMKFSHYIKKWWDKGDILSLKDNRLFGTLEYVESLYSMNALSSIARVQTHALVMLNVLFLVSLIVMMPAGRKYFRSSSSLKAD